MQNQMEPMPQQLQQQQMMQQPQMMMMNPLAAVQGMPMSMPMQMQMMPMSGIPSAEAAAPAQANDGQKPAEKTPNEIIGGIPTLTYFNLPNRGRGEVVRMFCHEAGIEFIDDRIELGAWPQTKQRLVEMGINPLASIPVLILNGKVYTQSVPILRLLCRLLGKYRGKTIEEEYFTDQIADIYIDWRASWVSTLGGNPEALQRHQQLVMPRLYSGINSFLTRNGGPFVLGTDFSYADVCVYQMMHDDGAIKDRSIIAGLPNLVNLADAVEKRPNIAKYLEYRSRFAAWP